MAKLTDSFTGADLAGLVQQASLQALHESLTVEVASEADVDLSVHKRHFLVALKNARPSVSAEVSISDLLHISVSTLVNFQFSSFNDNKKKLYLSSTQDKIQYEMLRTKFVSPSKLK